MSAALASVPIPSQLPADAGEWVLSFASRLRDQVAIPLLSAPTAKAFEEALPEALIRGAALRFRWLSRLGEMPAAEATTSSNAWLRPPSPSVLTELQRRAASLLGDERSFQLRRALALSLGDAIEGGRALLDRSELPGAPPVHPIEVARLVETAAPHDVLALVWMMVLHGDAPAPVPEVADAAATALLRLTSERLETMQIGMTAETAARPVPIDTRGSVDWLRAHPVLASPLCVLVGLACDDEATAGLSLVVRTDPEEEGLSIAELRLQVHGDPDEALARLDARALRAGVLSVVSDPHGRMIALTGEAVGPA